ncbi:IS3 family transposase [Leptospira borgpetersenii serovar Hardjo-bovis]|uniref:IS3 family transposase n=2 Tax=Leptospira borgpetersenii TaxID=174 RepID=UPI00059C46AB|nr:IS3 family transposase [Leptospira borgpetersenii]AMX59858.1 MerR family transcriptional regulator [Leptospira borgpetersenii serovar Hardjo]AMX63087.1 MerR family transcriptional regulator [Leptospira borgpetersenii serovar Hardjo]AMX66330.1 MerR family transcriptional regulator [Leptospira borgpetersenii serovar Hardjo]AMX69562.1 MerR family transcriptional regulator [Leptospira borgpetersenii serovar Hardjo]AWV71841.1 hypothetical protein B9T54_17970 [Leptospira borgpetersenii serovar Ha
MKYSFIEKNRIFFRIEKMCKKLNVSKSGYYAWLKRADSQTFKANQELDKHIRRLYGGNESRAGYLRIHKDLRAERILVSKNRVCKRMRKSNSARSLSSYVSCVKSPPQFFT